MSNSATGVSPTIALLPPSTPDSSTGGVSPKFERNIDRIFKPMEGSKATAKTYVVAIASIVTGFFVLTAVYDAARYLAFKAGKCDGKSFSLIDKVKTACSAYIAHYTPTLEQINKRSEQEMKETVTDLVKAYKALDRNAIFSGEKTLPIKKLHEKLLNEAKTYIARNCKNRGDEVFFSTVDYVKDHILGSVRVAAEDSLFSKNKVIFKPMFRIAELISKTFLINFKNGLADLLLDSAYVGNNFSDALARGHEKQILTDDQFLRALDSAQKDGKLSKDSAGDLIQQQAYKVLDEGSNQPKKRKKEIGKAAEKFLDSAIEMGLITRQQKEEIINQHTIDKKAFDHATNAVGKSVGENGTTAELKPVEVEMTEILKGISEDQRNAYLARFENYADYIRLGTTRMSLGKDRRPADLDLSVSGQNDLTENGLSTKADELISSGKLPEEERTSFMMALRRFFRRTRANGNASQPVSNQPKMGAGDPLDNNSRVANSSSSGKTGFSNLFSCMGNDEEIESSNVANPSKKGKNPTEDLSGGLGLSAASSTKRKTKDQKAQGSSSGFFDSIRQRFARFSQRSENPFAVAGAAENFEDEERIARQGQIGTVDPVQKNEGEEALSEIFINRFNALHKMIGAQQVALKKQLEECSTLEARVKDIVGERERIQNRMVTFERKRMTVFEAEIAYNNEKTRILGLAPGKRTKMLKELEENNFDIIPLMERLRDLKGSEEALQSDKAVVIAERSYEELSRIIAIYNVFYKNNKNVLGNFKSDIKAANLSINKNQKLLARAYADITQRPPKTNWENQVARSGRENIASVDQAIEEARQLAQAEEESN